MENTELKINEMADIAGGKIHFKPEPDRKGWIQHRVVEHDTLIRIANKYGIKDWHLILDWNDHINRNTNMIRIGEYLWIKQ